MANTSICCVQMQKHAQNLISITQTDSINFILTQKPAHTSSSSLNTDASPGFLAGAAGVGSLGF